MDQKKWILDTAHSSIEFGIKHMMISTVRGKFGNFRAEITGDPDDFNSVRAEFTIDVASIDTGNPDRDNDLRSDKIMAMKEYPQITFKTKRIRGNKENVEITGDLTIRGVTREVSFTGEYSGKIKDPYGNTRFGLSASATIQRSEFGVKWNMILEGGGMMLGEKVNLYLQLEAYAASAAPGSHS